MSHLDGAMMVTCILTHLNMAMLTIPTLPKMHNMGPQAEIHLMILAMHAIIITHHIMDMKQIRMDILQFVMEILIHQAIRRVDTVDTITMRHQCELIPLEGYRLQAPGVRLHNTLVHILQLWILDPHRMIMGHHDERNHQKVMHALIPTKLTITGVCVLPKASHVQ
jgi:hypothetical protein